VALVGMLSVERATLSGLTEEHRRLDKKAWAQVVNCIHQPQWGLPGE
jgi:hypothetical protein